MMAGLAGRIEHYSLAVASGVVLSGPPLTFTATPQVPFRPNALIINARAVTPRWATLLSRLFGWVRIPLVERDDGFWEWYWYRPALALEARARRRVQRAALARCSVLSVRIGVECLVGALPAAAAVGLKRLDLPSAGKGQRIEITLAGHGGPLDVMLLGMAPVSEKEDAHA